MVADREAALLGDLVLSALDLGVEEFLDLAALHADQVVVMAAFVEFEDRLAGFEVVALEQAGLLELRQHAIDGGQADVHAFVHQRAVDVLGSQVALIRALKEVEDLQARVGRLETDAFQVLGVVGHGGLGGVGDDVSLKLATRGGTGGHARRSQDPAYVIFFTPF